MRLSVKYLYGILAFDLALQGFKDFKRNTEEKYFVTLLIKGKLYNATKIMIITNLLIIII